MKLGDDEFEVYVVDLFMVCVSDNDGVLQVIVRFIFLS